MNPSKELQRLIEAIEPMPNVMVAFSGGVDSVVVLAAAIQAIGRERVLAVTADSQSLSRRELADCLRLVEQLGARHKLIETSEMELEGYRKNEGDRCYYCKGELYQEMTALPEFRSGYILLNGANTDDIGDWRPGMRAATEAGVRSPLLECGFGKEDVRALARELGLDVAEKPSSPCLASRIPYHSEVTPQVLHQIEAAEDFLKSEGFLDVRVRHYGSLARVEVPPPQIPLLMAPEALARLRSRLIEVGFQEVEVDPEGLVSGKLNRAIGKEVPEGTGVHASL